MRPTSPDVCTSHTPHEISTSSVHQSCSREANTGPKPPRTPHARHPVATAPLIISASAHQITLHTRIHTYHISPPHTPPSSSCVHNRMWSHAPTSSRHRLVHTPPRAAVHLGPSLGQHHAPPTSEGPCTGPASRSNLGVGRRGHLARANRCVIPIALPRRRHHAVDPRSKERLWRAHEGHPARRHRHTHWDR